MPSNTTVSSLPEVGFIRQAQLVPAIVPFSNATLWRKVKDGSFPAPVKLSPRVTAWEVGKVRGYLAFSIERDTRDRAKWLPWHRIK